MLRFFITAFRHMLILEQESASYSQAVADKVDPKEEYRANIHYFAAVADRASLEEDYKANIMLARCFNLIDCRFKSH